MQKKGDCYMNTSYNLNPRVRDLLKKRMENKEMSYMQVENVINSVMSAKYKKTLRDFTGEDKVKLINMLQSMFSTNLPKENIDVITTFLKDNYTDEEIKGYTSHILNSYKPGMVYNGVRVSNFTIYTLLETLGVDELYKGIIVNKRYINDLIPLLDIDTEDESEGKLIFDESTLMVEEDLSDEIIAVFNSIAPGTDLKFHMDENIFVMVTKDDEVVKMLQEKFKGLTVQSIPEFTFNFNSEYTPTPVVVEEDNDSDDGFESMI